MNERALKTCYSCWERIFSNLWYFGSVAFRISFLRFSPFGVDSLILVNSLASCSSLKTVFIQFSKSLL